MTFRLRPLWSAAALLVLSACGEGAPPPIVDDGSETDAEGEVLPGTISDEMIRYDDLGAGEAPAFPVDAALPAPAVPTDPGTQPPRPAAGAAPSPAATPTPARRPRPTPAATSSPAAVENDMPAAEPGED
ncbi:hypothetical protein EYB45_09310 [Erythrobacteraceae bacterium CFH 75059]|uniref:hypothetical protein n=1 Tax=Qipengyuania thermophila TaxID=2509361 RepID=UPI0010201586|nr:hypothetical protein [Qipengyuania thermophila]TCD04106.1 hypothetical protein EYB45_09310 [Erythrobacteraceae bacterium CFH 75059]